MNSASLHIRHYRPEDRESLLSIKCSVFKGIVLDNERRRFQWEIDENPIKLADIPVAFVLQAGDDVAGYFAFVPYRVQIGRQIVGGCTGIDLCLLDRFRGSGASHQFIQSWMAPGFCAFPFATALGSAATHLLKAAGAESLGGRLETIAYAYFVDHVHPPWKELPAHSVTGIQEFGREYDDLWDRIREHHRLILVKDALYMNWRYRDYPFEKPTLLAARDPCGTLSGIAVVQVDREFGRVYLCELLTEPGNSPARRGLLRASVDVARSSGEKFFYYSTRDAEQVDDVLETGFEPLPGPVPTFMARVNFTPSEGPVRVQDWHTSLGDGDQLFNIGEPGKERRA